MKHVHLKQPGSNRFLPRVTVKNSPLGGKGVFAARTFHRGERIGTYTGRVLGKASDPQVQALAAASPSTMLINVQGATIDGAQAPQNEAGQKALIGKVLNNGSEWPGAYAHIVNSAFDLESQKMRPGMQNCKVKAGGALVATKRIDVGQELLQNYGRHYHLGMK